MEDRTSEIEINENETTVFRKLGNQSKHFFRILSFNFCIEKDLQLSQITKGQNFDDFISKLPTIDYEDLIILEKLGEGGFSFVQKAFCKSTAQYIALKIYKPLENRTKEQLLEDIIYEDDLLRKVEAINDPMHFLKYYGIFRDTKPNSTFPIILQMESGSMSLEDVLQADIKFDPNEILSFLRDISKGFQILEESSIANRDIKPANIILWTNDKINLKKKNNYLFKISDFGIGCDLKSENTNLKGLSKSFAAPEVISQDPNVYDPIMADVYSLGITALKMIDYKNNDLEKLLKTLQYKPLWEEVHNVLEKMLKKNPKERITFKTLHENLSNFPIKEIDQTKESHYFELCCKNKEKKMGQNVDNLRQLYFEHYEMMKMYLKLTRIDKYQFHASLALDIFEELNKRNAISGLKHDKKQDKKNQKEDKRKKIKAKHQILIYGLIGKGFLEINQLEKAAEMFDNAFTACDEIYDLSKIDEELKKNNYQAKGLKLFTICNSYMGSYYKKIKNLKKAEELHQKAYDIGKNIKLDDYFKFDIFSGISLLWIAIDKTNEAEKLLLECLELEKIQKNDILLGLIYFFLARTLHKKQKASVAEIYCEKAIEQFVNANGGFCEISIYSNILMGKCQQILGENTKADQYVKKAIEIFEKNSEEKVEDIEKFKEKMEILQDERF